MEDELNELEAELQSLSPAAMPEALESRVFEALARGEAPAADNIVPFPLWRRVGAVAAVAVACVGVFFGVLNNFGPGRNETVASPTPPPMPVTPNVPAGNNFIPASADNTLRGVTDGGVFFNAEGQPVRQLRYQFSDKYLWTDPRDGTELELVIPRERRYDVPLRTD